MFSLAGRVIKKSFDLVMAYLLCPRIVVNEGEGAAS
jgi:hypothetical protein